MKLRPHMLVQWPAFDWGIDRHFRAGTGEYLRELGGSCGGFSVVRLHSGTEVVMPTGVLRKRRGGMAS